jgi:hypothetical protein
MGACMLIDRLPWLWSLPAAACVSGWRLAPWRRSLYTQSRHNTRKTPQENIWGNWNQIVEADAEALRRTAHILRFFGRLGFTASAGWEPHTREALQSDGADSQSHGHGDGGGGGGAEGGGGVYASRWPRGPETLWTLVNRACAHDPRPAAVAGSCCCCPHPQ